MVWMFTTSLLRRDDPHSNMHHVWTLFKILFNQDNNVFWGTVIRSIHGGM